MEWKKITTKTKTKKFNNGRSRKIQSMEARECRYRGGNFPMLGGAKMVNEIKILIE